MYQNTKNHRDFIRKFRLSSFPYKSLIKRNGAFKKALFDEFITTEQKPDIHLYTAQYVTDKEISEGWQITHDLMRGSRSIKTAFAVAANHVPYSAFQEGLLRINADFNSALVKNTLDRSFFSFDLDGTVTVKLLNEVKAEFDSFQKMVLKNDSTSQYDKDAEVVADSIAKLLSELGNKALASEVLDDLLNDSENIWIGIEAILGDKNQKYDENYRILKRHFNFHLRKHIDAIKLPTGAQGLSGRERVLIHCYQNKPAINHGQPGYADYLIDG